jgi:hypothetical protein
MRNEHNVVRLGPPAERNHDPKYRVRTRRAIEGRLALDLRRERRADDRARTTEVLHQARAA